MEFIEFWLKVLLIMVVGITSFLLIAILISILYIFLIRIKREGIKVPKIPNSPKTPPPKAKPKSKRNDPEPVRKPTDMPEERTENLKPQFPKNRTVYP